MTQSALRAGDGAVLTLPQQFTLRLRKKPHRELLRDLQIGERRNAEQVGPALDVLVLHHVVAALHVRKAPAVVVQGLKW